MLWFLLWLFLCVVTGMFAQIRRNRHGLGWGAVAFFFSPLVAFLLLLVLKERPDNKPYNGLVTGILVIIAATGVLAGIPIIMMI
jgi:hypothetical protein